MNINNIPSVQLPEFFKENMQDLLFPVMDTNKIKIHDNEQLLCEKLINLLKQFDKRVGVLRDVTFSASESKDYIAQHRMIKCLIADANQESGDPTFTAQYTYEIIKNLKPDSNKVYVLFISTTQSDEGQQTLTHLLDDIRQYDNINEGAIFESTGLQKIANSLIKILVKLAHFEEFENLGKLQIHNRININSRQYYTIKTDDLLSNAKSNLVNDLGDSVDAILHLLLPETWLAASNELVCNVVYQKFYVSKTKTGTLEGYEHNYDNDNDVQISLPNVTPNKLLAMKSILQRGYIQKANANQGKQEVFHINHKEPRESVIYYLTYLTRLTQIILEAAQVEHTNVTFAPNKRFRSFATLSSKEFNKRPLVIVDSFSDYFKSKQLTSKMRYKHSPEILAQVNKERLAHIIEVSSGKKGLPKADKTSTPYEVTNRYGDITDTYIAALRNTFSAVDDISIISSSKLSYQDMRLDVNYIFCQPSAHQRGYWYIVGKANRDKVIKILGEDYRAMLNSTYTELPKLGVAVTFDKNPIKIARAYHLAQNHDDFFDADDYTLIKVQQYQDKLAGNPCPTTQGLHMDNTHAHTLNVLNFPPSLLGAREPFSVDNINGKKDKVKGLVRSLYLFAERASVDLTIKHALTMNKKTPLPIIDHHGEDIDYGNLGGQYCSYYILRPKEGKKQLMFLASRVVFSINEAGEIFIEHCTLIDDEDDIREDDMFPITKACFNHLYNDSSYMVASNGNVLTSYTNKLVERLVATTPKRGTFKNVDFYHFVQHKVRNGQTYKLTKKAMVKRGLDHNNTAHDYFAIWLLPTYSKQDFNDPFDKCIDNNTKFHHHTLKKTTTVYNQTINLHPTKTAREWLYVKDNGTDGLKTYITPKDAAKEQIANDTRVHKIIVKDNQGRAISASDSPLSALYLQSINFNVVRSYDYSSTSMVNRYAKIYLTN